MIIGTKLKSIYYPDTIWQIYDIPEWSKCIDIEVLSGPGINIRNNIQCKYLAVSKIEHTTNINGLDIIDFEVVNE